MAQDLMKTISALQETALGRCRKRIADAGLRAKGITGDSPSRDIGNPSGKPPCGVTAILKRKHGL